MATATEQDFQESLALEVLKRVETPRRHHEWVSLEKVNDHFYVAYVYFYELEDERAFQVFLKDSCNIVRVRECPQT